MMMNDRGETGWERNPKSYQEANQSKKKLKLLLPLLND